MNHLIPACRTRVLLMTCLFTFIWADLASAQATVNPDPIEEVILSTFEVPQIRIVPITNDLSNPWGMVFRSNGDILVTERDLGQLRIIRNGELLEQAVQGLPEVDSERNLRAGLMGITLHPDDDSIVYFTYSTQRQVNNETIPTVALARGRLQDNSLQDVRDIFVAKGDDSGVAASWLKFAPDGKLLMTLGGAYVFAATGEFAQDTSTHFGKLLRLNDDGTPALDNPFVGNDDYLPEIYSLGHRNQLGLTFHPNTGDLWATENGPQGGDEANIITAGTNYGWPLVSYSRQYRGDWVTETPWMAEFEGPEVVWWPSIAPSGMTFYTGDKFPAWQGNLFVGSMMEGRIPGTGHIERIVFNTRGGEIRRESILREFRHRIRDVQQGPDGYLYVLTDEAAGALFRIEPAE